MKLCPRCAEPYADDAGFCPLDGTALALGDRLVQSDLANTLEAIAKDGPHAFYDGPIAANIAVATTTSASA